MSLCETVLLCHLGTGTVTRSHPGCLACKAQQGRAAAAPDPQGAGGTATYPLCWGVQAGARGAYVTGFVTSPGRGFGGEPAPKGRAVLLRAVLGAKLYFRGSEQGSES